VHVGCDAGAQQTAIKLAKNKYTPQQDVELGSSSTRRLSAKARCSTTWRLRRRKTLRRCRTRSRVSESRFGWRNRG